MGLKDVAAKNFFGKPEVLAELLDCTLFEGKKVLRNSRITDLCGEHLRIVRAEGGGYKTDNSNRDKLYKCDSGNEVVEIGVEFQALNDRKMVPRIMRYNSKLYSERAYGGDVHKIGNIVLSFDRNRKCASSLRQMIGGGKSQYDKLFFDYGYINLNIYELAEKLNKFPCGELRDVLYLFKCVKNNKSFMKDIAKSRLKRMRHMSRDAAFVCLAFLGFELDIDDDVEETDMCNEVRRFKRECRKEGELMALKKIVKRLFKKGFGIPEICDYTGASKRTVLEIVEPLES